MTRRASATESKSSPTKPATTQPADPAQAPVPMKPRKGLFVFLLVILAAWVGVLLGMYVKTVRSHRPGLEPPRATAPVVAGAQR
jgi:hypothetical protein